MIAATPSILAGALLVCLAPAVRGQDEPRPPNIVLFLVDDLGWTDLGPYGTDFHETPNIDRLTSEGLLFTNAYANAPNCAPTRASLMSGLYTPSHGIYTVNSSARGRTENRKLIPIPNTTVLAEDVLTIPEALEDAGYTSAALGKWHLGADPRTQGFDINIAGNQTGSPRGGYFSPYRNPDLPDGPEGENLTDRLTEEAVTFIEDADQPFFLYMSYYAVHTPVQGKPKLVDKYRAKPKGEHHGNPRYAAMVETMDRSVGRILGKLDALGIAGDTLVILFSDNGGHANFTTMTPLRGSKGMLYEGGIRTPLIARWPGRVEPGSRSAVPVMGIDLFPTFLDVAGLARPADTDLHGESLVPLLSGAAGPRRTALHWHFPAYLERYANIPGPWRTTPAAAVRVGDYKLIEFFEDGALELYDLSRDLGETDDLSEAMPDKVEELHAEMLAWRKRLGAPVPTERNPGYVPKNSADFAPLFGRHR